MPTNFAEGDLVQLKSGGPTMTVDDPANYTDRVECVWFSGSKLHRGTFHPGVLEPAPDEETDA